MKRVSIINYDHGITWGTHIVKITFQDENYKGYITHKINGNIKGMSVLNTDAEDVLQLPLLENNANLRYLNDDYEEDWFNMVLIDDQGEKLFVEDELRYLNDYVVAVEIIDFKEWVMEC